MRAATKGDYKKERERWTIERARQVSSFFPAGELTPSESPDWLIPNARVAIKVTYLTPPKPDGNKFSGPEISTFQTRVVVRAEHHYHAMNGPPCDVLVYFHNDFRTKRDPDALGRTLASFVLMHRPPDGECVTLESGELDDLPDWCSVIRIATLDGGWSTSTSAEITLIERDYLADCIAAKDKLLSLYRARASGYQIWLLVATLPSVLWSAEVPDSLTNLHFTFDFDKVFVLTWLGEVIELNHE